MCEGTFTYSDLFQPFPSDGNGHRATDTGGEYSHAEEHCGRGGVRLPVVGVLSARSASTSGFDPGLMVCFVPFREL